MSQLIKFYLTSMFNMFRILIHPSSGACDFSVVSPHWLRVLISMCVGVSVVIQQKSRRLLMMDVLMSETRCAQFDIQTTNDMRKVPDIFKLFALLFRDSVVDSGMCSGCNSSQSISTVSLTILLTVISHPKTECQSPECHSSRDISETNE